MVSPSAHHVFRTPVPREPYPETIDDCYLVGSGFAMQKVRSQLRRIAPYVRMALIVGEAGTGKGAIARKLHERSTGAHGPFVAHHATTLASHLESEMECGEAIRSAEGGTLFLHNLCSLSSVHQSRLLHLLHMHEELRSQRSDLRVIASSRNNLRTLAATGQFHEDLYRRLAAVEITLPPLRTRTEDIGPIVEALLHHLTGGNAIAPAALVLLERHAWPENVGAIRKVLEKAVLLADGAPLQIMHLDLPRAAETSTPGPAEQRLESLEDVVRRHVLSVLTQCAGNKLRASEILGISRSTLYRMLDSRAAGRDS